MQSDKILKKYKDVFKALEEYDKTGKLPPKKAKTGKPVSQIIERKFS
jgi:hypothetical protein